MPKLDDLPPGLRSFVYHGVELWKTDTSQAEGTCPFCLRDKLYVDPETSLWYCHVCDARGNVFTFLQKLWQQSIEARSLEPYTELCQDRGYLDQETPIQWGLVQSFMTGDWLTPGYNSEGAINQLYRWTRIYQKGEWKRRNLPTPGLESEGDGAGAGGRHGIHGLGALWDDTKSTVYVCEGIWDGMMFWESLPESLLTEANVIAVPGCNVFNSTWCSLLAGKRVVLLYHSDHPRTHPLTGKKIPSEGTEAMKRVCAQLTSSQTPPLEIDYLDWGSEGYDPELPSGYDLRDLLGVTDDRRERQELLVDLLSERVHGVPTDWIQAPKEPDKQELTCLECKDYKTLVNAWRKALDFIEGLDKALSVMLACAVSTTMTGDQLWIKILGPPSCGKSTLSEAMAVDKKHVYALSVLRRIHSGYKSDKTGSVDYGLVPHIRDRTVIVKDGDTLLRNPNKDIILSELRDLYDTVARVHYGQGVHHNYDNVRTTFIICGTNSLRELDSSELGERCLDCLIADEIDTEMEYRVGLRAAYEASRELCYESNGEVLSRESPEKINAKRLTGGYVYHLRKNARDLVGTTVMPDWAISRCNDLGVFVAYMRAHSKGQTPLRSHSGSRDASSGERELSFRLVKQLVRLAKCLAAVMNSREVDAAIMKRVSSVAFDTARGKTFDVVKFLYSIDHVIGSPSSAVAIALGETDDRTRGLLRALYKLKVVEVYERTTGIGMNRTERRWRLTRTVLELYDRVFPLLQQQQQE